MLISLLKYIKVLRNVSILTDHHQGVGLTSLKLLNYLKNTEFNNSVTLMRYRPTPWWWSVKIETCRSTFMYLYVF